MCAFGDNSLDGWDLPYDWIGQVDSDIRDWLRRVADQSILRRESPEEVVAARGRRGAGDHLAPWRALYAGCAPETRLGLREIVTRWRPLGRAEPCDPRTGALRDGGKPELRLPRVWRRNQYRSGKNGGGGWTRTTDIGLMRPPLYQLSYAATGRETEELLAGRHPAVPLHHKEARRTCQAPGIEPLESSRSESCWMGLTIPG